MKPILFALLASLALTACQNSSTSTGVGDPEAVGSVAFRLQSLEISVLATTSDSIRVEAERIGYPTVSGVAGLRDSVSLDGLQAGLWTIRVASFDSAHGIQWYGDTLANIRPGTRNDVTVHLRKATGSAMIHIVLDSGDIDTARVIPIHDTLAPVPDTARIGSGSYHLLGAQMVGNQLVMRTVYDCNNHPELRRWVDTAGTIHIVLGTRMPSTRMACAAMVQEQVVVYTPFVEGESIVAEDLFGNRFLFLAPPPILTGSSDFRFISLSFEQGGGFTADASSYRVRLDSMGNLFVEHSSTSWSTPSTPSDSQRVDVVAFTRIDTATRMLTPFELDTAKLLLNSTSISHPGAIDRGNLTCADAGWWKAALFYNFPPADGYVATYDKPEEVCSNLPVAYDRFSNWIWPLIFATTK